MTSRRADIPIIFSGPMVLALLAGRKTMTRRLAWRAHTTTIDTPGLAYHSKTKSKATIWQRVKPGDRLWVRESICRHNYLGFPLSKSSMFMATGERIWSYAADGYGDETGRIPSIRMPRWASRLTLVVTAVRIERLQDISEEDAIAEGCEASPEDVTYWWDGYDTRILDRDGNAGSVSQCAVGKYENKPPEWMEMARRSKHTRQAVSARSRFETLWRILHGPGAWDANPWVVASTFTVHRRNIDALGKEAA